MNQNRVLFDPHSCSGDWSDPADSSAVQHTHSSRSYRGRGSISSSSAHRKHLTVRHTLIHTDQRNYLKGDRPSGSYDNKPVTPDCQVTKCPLNTVFLYINTYVNAIWFIFVSGFELQGETTVPLFSSHWDQTHPCPPDRPGHQAIFTRCGCSYCGYTECSSVHWFRAVTQGSSPSSYRLDTPTPTSPSPCLHTLPAHMGTPTASALA